MQIIICQIFINMLNDRSTGKQCFQLFRDIAACIINKWPYDRIVTGVLPIARRFCFRIMLQLQNIVHNIPWTINVKISKMISIVPFFHTFRMFFCPSIFKDPVHLILHKSEIFIQAWVGDRVRNEIIGPRKDTFLCDLQASRDYSKPDRLVIF